ncbi:lactadherin-like [Stylophora pistillata]|uniref:lactadherin-like n=1 Tax=Stylophora pistillata TaxID=50429 RepID=UPI000C04FD39|nr:lactadherin-like [Stylophora pistillata]
MTASSMFDDDYASYLGRLNETRRRGGWCPKTTGDRTDYLQVDMGSVLSVCAVATQGEEVLPEWTTNYKLNLSIDGLAWNPYEETNKTKVFQGNSDQTSIVKHSLRTDFKARYVRFYPVSYHKWPCLRVEIYVFK